MTEILDRQNDRLRAVAFHAVLDAVTLHSAQISYARKIRRRRRNHFELWSNAARNHRKMTNQSFAVATANMGKVLEFFLRTSVYIIRRIIHIIEIIVYAHTVTLTLIRKLIVK